MGWIEPKGGGEGLDGVARVYTVKKNLGLKPSKYGLPRKNLLKLVCFPVGSYPSSY